MSSGFQNDELGSNLIIGSGAFNNLVIAAISICSIPAGQVLYCAVLSCTVLCCTVVSCTVLHCTVQVRRLQHHASLALWAANNENEAALRGNWYGTDSRFQVRGWW